MSNSESFAVARPSPRGFISTLMLGGLCAALALMAQSTNFSDPKHASFVRPAMVRRIDPPMMVRLIDPPATASVYDQESTMSAAQLLGRWDALITEASKRFHLPKAWIRAVMARESGGRTMLGKDMPIVSQAGAAHGL